MEEEVIIEREGIKAKPISEQEIKVVEGMEKNGTETKYDKPETKSEILKKISESEEGGMLGFAREALVTNERKKERVNEKEEEPEIILTAEDEELGQELGLEENELDGLILDEGTKEEQIIAIEPVSDDEIKEQEDEPTIILTDEDAEDRDYNEELDEELILDESNGMDNDPQIISTHTKLELKQKYECVGPGGVYELLEKIGEGGFGEVWKAREKTTGILKAVKKFNEKIAEKLSVKRLEDKIKEINARTGKEAVKIEHVCDDKFGKYVVMEYCPKTFDTKEQADAQKKFEKFLAVLEAVYKLHEKGIVHGDLKPTNMLIDEEGKVRLTDFDLAQIIEREDKRIISEDLRTKTIDAKGISYAYAAPEKIKGEKTDKRADIYSLGILLYEILTSELPGTDIRGELEEKGYSTELIDLVIKATKKKKEDRFKDIEEINGYIMTKELTENLEDLDTAQEITKKFTVEMPFEIATIEVKEENAKEMQDISLQHSKPMASHGKEENKNANEIYSLSSLKKWSFMTGRYDTSLFNLISHLFNHKELAVKITSIADKINTILTQHSAKPMKLERMEIALVHPTAPAKKANTINELERLVELGYEIKTNWIPTPKNTKQTEEGVLIYEGVAKTPNIFSFKSDVASLKIGYTNRLGTEPLIGIELELKDPFEKNLPIYVALEKYIKNLKYWWSNRRHFKKLTKEGYNYENARELFKNGFGNFSVGTTKYKNIILETTNSGKEMAYDKSDERKQTKALKRHLRLSEVCEIISDGLEGKLKGTKMQEAYEQMLKSREWVNMAFEESKDRIIVYLDPEGIQNKGDFYEKTPDFKYSQKKEFDIIGLPKATWVELKKFDKELIKFVYGRPYEELPDEIKTKAQIWTSYSENYGKIFPVGFGIYSDIYLPFNVAGTNKPCTSRLVKVIEKNN